MTVLLVMLGAVGGILGLLILLAIFCPPCFALAATMLARLLGWRDM